MGEWEQALGQLRSSLMRCREAWQGGLEGLANRRGQAECYRSERDRGPWGRTIQKKESIALALLSTQVLYCRRDSPLSQTIIVGLLSMSLMHTMRTGTGTKSHE